MKNFYRLIIGILILVLTMGAVVTTTTNAATSPVVSVTYVISADWGTGYNINFTIKNNTANTIPGGWKFSFTLIGDQKIIYPTPPVIIQSGSEVTYTAPAYMSIPPGGSVNIGFSISGIGRGITNMKFNGVPVGGLM